MTLDATRACELLVGLEDMTVLAVEEDGVGLVVAVESGDRPVGCAGCGTRAQVKDRPEVAFGDLTSFGRPATLVWRKRRWSCPDEDCPVGSWTETNPQVAAPRCGLTRRAGLWACRQVGQRARPVSSVADELGCSWWAVMSAVTVYGTPLVEDPDRTSGVEMLGVDETSFLKAQPTTPTRWVSAVVDVGRRRAIDLFEGRNAADLDAWLEAQPERWKEAVTVAVTDLHEPFRAALSRHLAHATQVADPFHVVAVGTRAVDTVRRRIQQETLGHRGRRGDPLYRARKLLTLAAERLDSQGHQRLHRLLRAGDPHRELYDTWIAKECLRDLYTLAAAPALAADWLDQLVDDLADSPVTELRGMARTLRRWRGHILAWHTTGASNGPAEAVNLLIKKVKRVGHGFRRFANYRLRVLLYTGACNWALLGQ
jgi:transposase